MGLAMHYLRLESVHRCPVWDSCQHHPARPQTRPYQGRIVLLLVYGAAERQSSPACLEWSRRHVRDEEKGSCHAERVRCTPAP